jgi:high-affinity nickel permease
LLEKNLKDEQLAKEKLIRQINQIEDDKNKVGRYVLTIFVCVFILAATLLAVVLLNPQAH